MNFSVATNWDENLIKIIGHAEIKEVFGKLRNDFVGGGRVSVMLPLVTKKAVKQYINKLHKEGKEFNYLLNSTCLGNSEFTISGQNKLCEILDWLAEMDVDWITIAIPYLLKFIKKKYPQFKIQVSSSAMVDSIRKVTQWEDLGADAITLARWVNREFKILEGIRKNTKRKLQLIASGLCTYDCIFCLFDMNVGSHASRSLVTLKKPLGHPFRGPLCPEGGLPEKPLAKNFDNGFYVISCGYNMLYNPIEFIRSTWIRPEDVCYYEKLGIDSLKLLDRMSSTEQLSRIISAYTNRRYKGNLLRLLIPYHLVEKRDFLVEQIYSAIYIDNQSLDGFLKYFFKESCILKNCKKCHYCRKIAKKVIRINDNLRHFLLFHLRGVLDKLEFLGEH